MGDFFQAAPDYDKKLKQEKHAIINSEKINFSSEKDLEEEYKEEIDKRFLYLHLKDKELDYELKKLFSKKVVMITICWFVFIASVSILHIQNFINVYRFSDSVLMIMYSTTTANVIGLMIVILHYLFPNNKKN